MKALVLYAVAAMLGVLAAVAITGCGGSPSAIGSGASVTRSTPTRTINIKTQPATSESNATPTPPAATTPPTQTTTSAPQPTTAPPTAQVTITRGETQTATIVQTTTVTPAPPATSTESSGVNPAAAAAAAAASNDEESSTDWGWVAFGILAGAVLIFGVVWWIRRRHAKNGDGGDAPPVSA